MTKLWERVKEKLRQIRYEWWKKDFEEYTTFEVEEDNKSFIISLNFKSETSYMLKEEVSKFFQNSLKKEAIDIVTTIQLIRRLFNVVVDSEGIEGKKVLLFITEERTP